jgi:hypothetical protein
MTLTARMYSVESRWDQFKPYISCVVSIFYRQIISSTRNSTQQLMHLRVYHCDGVHLGFGVVMSMFTD